MNPRRAILGQAVALAGLLSALALMGTVPATIAVLVIASSVGVFGLCHYSIYRIRLRGPEATQRSPWRITNDRIALCEVLGPSLIPLGVVGVVQVTGSVVVPGVLELGTLLFGAALVLAFILGSSFVDWFRILPERDGLVCLPPCWTSGQDRWRKTTKAWFLHRTVAEIAFGVGPTVIIFAVLFELFTRAPSGIGLIGKAVSLVGLVGGSVARFSVGKVSTGGKALRTPPPFALGDTITWVSQHESLGHLDLGWLSWDLTTEGWTLEVTLGNWFAKSWATKRAPHGSKLYVMDVALDTVRVVRATGAEGLRQQPLRPATRDLLENGTIRGPVLHLSPCREAGRCLVLNDRCERRPGNRGDVDAPQKGATGVSSGA